MVNHCLLYTSYVIALANAANVDGMYIDEAQNGMSFRNYGNLLLLGGGGHRTGKKGGNWQELRNFARQYYPNATEKYLSLIHIFLDILTNEFLQDIIKAHQILRNIEFHMDEFIL